MKQKRLCYISRDYYNQTSAGNKAKTDTEETLVEMGAINLGLHRTIKNSKIFAFFRNLAGIIRACILLKKGDILFLQYPIKKYFTFICTVARFKGAKTISLIHDIGSIRTHRLTTQQEVKRLSHSDYILATNNKMKEWLISNNFQKPIEGLGLWDYRSPYFNKNSHPICNPGNISSVYAGAIHVRKNPFLIQLSKKLKTWNLIIYGKKEELTGWANNPLITFKGFVQPDEFIRTVKADFGLVWDGDSLDTCSGIFGEYLKWNTPHKVSFYLRAGLPIIIWKQAAVTPILEKAGVCIAINTLSELEQKLNELSSDELSKMKENTKRLAERLNQGFFLRQALDNYLSVIYGMIT